MIYLAYVHGWSCGEPYDILVSINKEEADADKALKTYLSKFPLDTDGNAYTTSLSLEFVDSFTSSVRRDLSA